MWYLLGILRSAAPREGFGNVAKEVERKAGLVYVGRLPFRVLISFAYLLALLGASIYWTLVTK